MERGFCRPSAEDRLRPFKRESIQYSSFSFMLTCFSRSSTARSCAGTHLHRASPRRSAPRFLLQARCFYLHRLPRSRMRCPWHLKSSNALNVRLSSVDVGPNKFHFVSTLRISREISPDASAPRRFAYCVEEKAAA